MIHSDSDSPSFHDDEDLDVRSRKEAFLEEVDILLSTLLPTTLTYIMKQYVPNCSWKCICMSDTCGRFGCTTDHEKCVVCHGGCCEMCETVCESCRRKHICSRCV